MGTDYLTLEYRSKKALLTSLESELRTLVSNNIDSDTIKQLEEQTVAQAYAYPEDTAFINGVLGAYARSKPAAKEDTADGTNSGD